MGKTFFFTNPIIILIIFLYFIINAYVLQEDDSCYLLIKTIPEKCKIYLDGIYKGLSPITLKISQGQHKIKIVPYKNKNYKEKIIKYIAIPQEKKQLTIKLKNLTIYYFDIGYKFYKNKNYEKAIKNLKLSLNYNNEYKKSRYLLGKIFIIKKDYKNALFYLKPLLKILKKEEELNYTLYYIAQSYYYLKNYKKSCIYYYKVLKYFYPYNMLEYSKDKIKNKDKNNKDKFFKAIYFFKNKNYEKSNKILKNLTDSIFKNLNTDRILYLKEE